MDLGLCRDALKPLLSRRIESNNTLKESYTIIKWDLPQGCKDYLYPQINLCDTPHEQIEGKNI